MTTRRVLSNADPAQLKAMLDILGNLVGTPLEQTGEPITIEVKGQRYELAKHHGTYTFAVVEKS